MREFMESPVIERPLADGNVIRIVFNSATHIYVTVVGKFRYKGKAYHVTAHLSRKEDESWSEVDRDTGFYIPDAPSENSNPKSVFGAIRALVLSTVNGFIASTEGFQYRARGEQVRANNTIRRLEEAEADLRAKLQQVSDDMVKQCRIESEACSGVLPTVYREG